MDIRKLYEKDYLGQWDTEDGDLVLTISGVAQEEVQVPNTSRKEKKVVLTFRETPKKLVLNSTNRDIIAKQLAKSWNIDDFKGVQIALYTDKSVRCKGEIVGGLRVRPQAPKQELFCEVCGQQIKASNGKSPKMIAESTRAKYGKAMCSECAIKEYNSKKGE